MAGEPTSSLTARGKGRVEGRSMKTSAHIAFAVQGAHSVDSVCVSGSF